MAQHVELHHVKALAYWDSLSFEAGLRLLFPVAVVYSVYFSWALVAFHREACRHAITRPECCSVLWIAAFASSELVPVGCLELLVLVIFATF